jgi:hypothetical protein
MGGTPDRTPAGRMSRASACSVVSGTSGPHVEQYGMNRNGFHTMSSAAAVAGIQSAIPNTAAVTVAAAFTLIEFS